MTRDERLLRELLTLAANTVHPDIPGGLARIQQRTGKTSAPGACLPGAPQTDERKRS